MPFAFFQTHSQATTARDEVVPSQAEIERQIAKLKEDSAKDVQRQLEQQRVAEKEARVKEDARKAAEHVEEGFAPAWKAAEQHVETIIEDAETDVRNLRMFRKHVENTEEEE